VAETSLACESAARSPHQREACWRRDGSRFRSLKHCAGFGEPAGRIGAPRWSRGQRSDGRPAYVERECWRCDWGRVYQPASPREGTPGGGWVPCPTCRGTGKAIVFVYAKKDGRGC